MIKKISNVDISTSFSLKLTALMFMILDHVHTYLNVGPRWISLLPRFVAPLFVFFLVEGFNYSKNRKRYLGRLFSFAVIMLGGNIMINILFHRTNILTNEMDFYSIIQGNNIFMTLTAFFCILILLEKIKNSSRRKKLLYLIPLMFMIIFSVLFCEGGIYLLPILLIFYYTRANKRKLFIGVLIWSFILLVKALANYFSGATSLSLSETLFFNNEWAMVFVLIPIYLYSGKRGRNDIFAKWLFYVIYPLHIWILVILNLLFIN